MTMHRLAICLTKRNAARTAGRRVLQHVDGQWDDRAWPGAAQRALLAAQQRQRHGQAVKTAP